MRKIPIYRAREQTREGFIKINKDSEVINYI